MMILSRARQKATIQAPSHLSDPIWNCHFRLSFRILIELIQLFLANFINFKGT